MAGWLDSFAVQGLRTPVPGTSQTARETGAAESAPVTAQKEVHAWADHPWRRWQGQHKINPVCVKELAGGAKGSPL